MVVSEWWQQNGAFERVLYLLIETDDGDIIKIRADGTKALSQIVEDEELRRKFLVTLHPYVDD